MEMTLIVLFLFWECVRACVYVYICICMCVYVCMYVLFMNGSLCTVCLHSGGEHHVRPIPSPCASRLNTFILVEILPFEA